MIFQANTQAKNFLLNRLPVSPLFKVVISLSSSLTRRRRSIESSASPSAHRSPSLVPPDAGKSIAQRFSDPKTQNQLTKQQPSISRSGHQISCCLASLHFLRDILSDHPVHWVSDICSTVGPWGRVKIDHKTKVDLICGKSIV